MKITKLAFFCLFVSFVNHVFAQEYKFAFDSAVFYIKKNDFVTAVPYLEKAKKSVLTLPIDTVAYIEILKLLSVGYARTQKISLAEATFKENVVLLQNQLDRRKQLVSVLTNFGVFYYNQKKYAEALPIFENALSFRKKLSDSLHIEALSIQNNVAACQVYLKQYALAEKNYIAVIGGRKELLGGNHPEYVQSLNALAALYKTVQNNEKALELYLEIETAIKSINGEKSKQYGIACVNLGQLYKSLDKFREASFYLNLGIKALQISVGENNQEYINASLQLASIYRLQGQFALAEYLYNKSQDAIKAQYGTNSLVYVSYLNNVSLFYSETGKYDIAEASYKLALEITRQILGELHPEMAATLYNLGLFYKNIGRYNEAETQFNKSKRVIKENLGENTLNYALVLNNLATIYEYTGQFPLSEPLYKQSLQIIKTSIGEHNADYAITLNNLANVYENQGKFVLAAPIYLQSLKIIKEVHGETSLIYASNVHNWAMFLIKINRSVEAETIVKQYIESLKKLLNSDHPVLAEAIGNYGILLERMAKYKESEVYFLKSLQMKVQIYGESSPMISSSTYNLAKHFTNLKNYPEADKYWDKAIQNYLAQIENHFSAMGQNDRIRFVQTIKPVFEQFNSYCLLRVSSNPDVLKQMYDCQIASKGLIFSPYDKVKTQILNSGDKNLINLYKKWAENKELLYKYANLTLQEQKLETIPIETIYSTINNLEEQLNSFSTNLKLVAQNQKITWKDIQPKLKKDEAAIEMIRFNKYKFDSAGVYNIDSVFYAALVLNAQTTRPSIVIIKNGAELEKQYFKLYRNAIKNKIEDQFSYAQYWNRIKRSISNVKTVYFSSDGVYNLINLNSLKNSQTQTYVWDELDLKNVTNTKDFLTINKISNTDKKMILVGNPDYMSFPKNPNTNSLDQLVLAERAATGALFPLPNTKLELEKIKSILQNQTWEIISYTDKEANEENLKKINNPTLLHLATHSYFESDDNDANKNNKSNIEKINKSPLFKSGLFLAGASVTLMKRKNDQINLGIDTRKEDGILTGCEVLNLPLEKTDLVILSANETAFGDQKNGAAVFDLQRAFGVAGAKTIVFSLWADNEIATQKLMSAFYQELSKTNITYREAFRNAQKIVKAEFPEPFYWASFVLVGE